MPSSAETTDDMTKRPRSPSPNMKLSAEEVQVLEGYAHPALEQVSDKIKRNTLIVSSLDEMPEEYKEGGFLCTHHGGFHCDEAVALAMLKILPEFENLPIMRTRDPKVIEKALLVVDVGGIHSHEQRR